MSDIKQVAHQKAVDAILKLAEKAESKGRKEAGESMPGKDWIEGIFPGTFINYNKLLEAATYYDIARNIIDDEVNQSFFIFSKGRLLEEIGEYSEAIDSYKAASIGDYEAAAAQGISRCQARAQGKPAADAYISQVNALMPDMADLLESLLNPDASLNKKT